jgi:hypothetical protein
MQTTLLYPNLLAVALISHVMVIQLVDLNGEAVTARTKQNSENTVH